MKNTDAFDYLEDLNSQIRHRLVLLLMQTIMLFVLT